MDGVLVENEAIEAQPVWRRFAGLRDRLRASVVGQNDAAEHLLVALLGDGHVLLEGAPGLAKTRLARVLAHAIEGSFNRIQFTPDLLPSDLTGAPIYHPHEHRFEFQRGPLFANFILADEINRAPAKVQSALLEAMEERQITVGDTSHPLEQPFFVIATQNPIEHDGTWDLPQAQLDRFFVHVEMDYPAMTVEREILDLVMGEVLDEDDGAVADLVSKADVHAARRAVVRVHASELIKDFVVRLVAGTRGEPAPLDGVAEHLSHPISPRGSIMLVRAAQARAWLAGRDHVLPEDVESLAPPVLRHRIGLNYRAEADGVPPGSIIGALLDQVRVV